MGVKPADSRPLFTLATLSSLKGLRYAQLEKVRVILVQGLCTSKELCTPLPTFVGNPLKRQ